MITIRPNLFGGRVKRDTATPACGGAVENLLQRGLARISDQAASQVFLQGLMCARSPLAQNAVGMFRDVLDLHTGHGAILALLAPNARSDSMHSSHR
jgi:hypothetical protein